MGTSSVSDSVEDEAGDAGSRGEFIVDCWAQFWYQVRYCTAGTALGKDDLNDGGHADLSPGRVIRSRATRGRKPWPVVRPQLKSEHTVLLYINLSICVH